MNKRVLIAIVTGVVLLCLALLSLSRMRLEPPRGPADAAPRSAGVAGPRASTASTAAACMCTFEEAPRGAECDEHCAREQLYNPGWEFHAAAQRSRAHPRYYPAFASVCERSECASLRATQPDLVRESAVALWLKTGRTAFPAWFAASLAKFPRARAAVALLRSGDFEAFAAGLQREKTRGYAVTVPGALNTYNFKTEAEYYDAYATAWYAHTWCVPRGGEGGGGACMGVSMCGARDLVATRAHACGGGGGRAKAGYDAMRHVEIIGNGAIPVFRASERIPEASMVGCVAPRVRRCHRPLFDDKTGWHGLAQVPKAAHSPH
jgi:hypothetical protein